VIADGGGIPLAARLTAANVNDVTQLEALVAAIPPVRGKPGRPKQKPALVQADRGYDSASNRAALALQNIDEQIARRDEPHGSGLGRTRWVIERTISWLHQYRRLRVRYERRADIHEAFLSLACALICWKHLQPLLC